MISPASDLSDPSEDVIRITHIIQAQLPAAHCSDRTDFA